MQNTEKKPSLKLFWWLIIWLIVFFLWFVLINEYTIQSWEDLYLEILPVDPRDPLRWDYVILRYAFENNENIKEFSKNLEENKNFYISFKKDIKWIGSIDKINEKKPKNGIFLKIKNWNFGIKTWISKYFVKEWTWRKIENLRRRNNNSNIIVHLKVDNNWKAQIIDLSYDWKNVYDIIEK